MLWLLLSYASDVRVRPWPEGQLTDRPSPNCAGRDTGEDPDSTPPLGPCEPDGARVGATCMDLCEAPNVAGDLPLVMYTFDDAEAWCAAREKRLCFDDEWDAACEGPAVTQDPSSRRITMLLPGTP